MSKELLLNLRQDIKSCTSCSLHKQFLPVPGEGHPQADLMIVAEAPGQVESDPKLYDEFGIPLVGPAGQKFQELLHRAGWEPHVHKVFATNVIKHRPPNNRTPTLDEQIACQPFLIRQIKAIQPKIILALGRVATDTLCRIANIERLGSFASMEFPIKLETYTAKVLTTYHPSYILRNPSKEDILFEDLVWVLKTLEK